MAETPHVESGLLKPGALLHTMRLSDVSRKPLMMEFPVPPTPPFLVTASRPLRLMWITQARSNRVRAAVQPVPSTADLFSTVVRETMAMGLASEWENVHPLTKDGLQAAIDHPKFYGLDQLQLLAHPDFDWAALDPEWSVSEGNTAAVVLGCPVEHAPWMGLHTVVAIPRDRGFIGFVIEIGEDHAIAVIHNASRALGIATSQPEPEEAEAGEVAG